MGLRLAGGGELRLASPPLLTLALATLALVVSLEPQLAEAVQYDRAALAQGELWRGVLGHFTHWSRKHLLWDLVPFLALGSICEGRDRGAFAGAVIIAAIAIPITLWWAAAEIALYRGLSGIDSALVAPLVVGFVRDARRTGSRVVPMIGLGVALGLALKVGRELLVGDALFLPASTAGFTAVPLAHVAGAGAGLLACLLGHLLHGAGHRLSGAPSRGRPSRDPRIPVPG